MWEVAQTLLIFISIIFLFSNLCLFYFFYLVFCINLVFLFCINFFTYKLYEMIVLGKYIYIYIYIVKFIIIKKI